MFSSRIRRKELIKTSIIYWIYYVGLQGRKTEVPPVALLDDCQYTSVFCLFTRSLFSESVSQEPQTDFSVPSCPSSPTRSCSNVLLNWVTKISFKNSEHSTGHTFPTLFTPTTDLKNLKANYHLQSTHSHALTIPSSLFYGFSLVCLKLGRR